MNTPLTESRTLYERITDRLYGVFASYYGMTRQINRLFKKIDQSTRVYSKYENLTLPNLDELYNPSRVELKSIKYNNFTVKNISDYIKICYMVCYRLNAAYAKLFSNIEEIEEYDAERDEVMPSDIAKFEDEFIYELTTHKLAVYSNGSIHMSQTLRDIIDMSAELHNVQKVLPTSTIPSDKCVEYIARFKEPIMDFLQHNAHEKASDIRSYGYEYGDVLNKIYNKNTTKKGSLVDAIAHLNNVVVIINGESSSGNIKTSRIIGFTNEVGYGMYLVMQYLHHFMKTIHVATLEIEDKVDLK
jgi:hypothetical protein